VSIKRFPVEEGQILMFARAVGDPNPIYTDATYAAGSEVGSIIAPPTFVQSGAHFDPDFPMRPKQGEPWIGSGRTASGAGTGETGGGSPRLHAEQEFNYYRPVRPGDILTTSFRQGDAWEKQGRSGTLVFSEFITEYRDQDGELVVTARSVGVITNPASEKGIQ
jgi:acyl dehydratase